MIIIYDLVDYYVQQFSAVTAIFPVINYKG